MRRATRAAGAVLLLGALYVVSIRGLPRDRLGGLGPITSASLATLRSVDGRQWVHQVVPPDLATLDQELRAHPGPLVGGLSLPAARASWSRTPPVAARTS